MVEADTQSRYSRPYQAYVLVLLLLVSLVSQVDRQVLNILMESIKADLHATDAQMGLLNGVCFSVFYLVAAIPIARWADRGSRRLVLAVCIGAWSLATMASGMARAFSQLAVARMFVAVGEGGSQPAMFSLLTDVVSRRARSRAIGLVSGGTAIGIGLGVLLGGTLHQIMGWRMVFIVVGLPGLILAPLLRLTLPEPVRTIDPAALQAPSMLTVFKDLWRAPAFRFVLLIATLAGASGLGVIAWIPTFFLRVHKMGSGELGLKLGLATAIGLLLGNISTGYLSDRLSLSDPRWRIWVAGVGLFLAAPVGLAALFVPNASAGIAVFGLFCYLLAFWGPALVSTTVSIAEPASRAVSVACVYVFIYIGGALGPFLIGEMTDTLFGLRGASGIRYSIAVSLIGCALAGLICFLAGGAVRRDYLARLGAGDALA